MKKAKNIYPVSEKYYRSLQNRVKAIFNDLGLKTLFALDTLKIIDRYLLTGVEKYDGMDKVCKVVFITLRDEIDMAVERSRRARARAQERRLRKQSENKDRSKDNSHPRPAAVSAQTINKPKAHPSVFHSTETLPPTRADATAMRSPHNP